ncbi:MAG: PD-(D/E)XK nuclease family protein [Bacteroidales bacterium]|nr:PD-(D/E)XK nuclease family protein [Bacteroidales bacterium]MCP5515578.1 PD-(D/E)XK nuclease family protein [Spirochaetales bacterium]
MNTKVPFLKTLAESVFHQYGTGVSDLCMIFPNRRSGVFFKKYLAEAAGKTIWSPQIFTISEFMQFLSDSSPADPVDLVFEVYKSYRKFISLPESLDEFWSWGEMMLSDFDDIDKYMVDASSLYLNIKDMKEIDQMFELEEEQKETIRKFWGFFGSDNLSGQKESFLRIWSVMLSVYTDLNLELKKKGLAYEGMIYREVAENIKSGSFPELPWSKIIVSGFNALNKAEKELFRYLRNSGKARFFWDYDKYYIENQSSEAGRFLRTNIAEFPPDADLEDFDNIHKKEVSIFELPTDIIQAKYLNTLLKGEDAKELSNFNHTALVLGNEDLMLPVLSSLPSNVPEINITMGYPFNATPVFSFVDQLLKLQKNIASHHGSRKNKFYHREVLSLLNHQYLKLAYEDKVLEKIQEINRKNLIYIEPSFFGDEGLMSLIFRKVSGSAELADYIRDILLELVAAISKDESKINNLLEKEFIFHLLTRLNKLKGIFSENKDEAGMDIFSRILKKMLRNLRIPFEGEPLAGLQVMGILETRLLDFQHVVFLSMNDGIMPRAHQSFSYIPHNLRFAYGMPTREDQDAIYAYYFYRLLQRADRISVLYNSKSDGLNTGEKSRYIFQMLFDERFVTRFRSIGFNISGRDALSIQIPKSPEIIKILNIYSKGSTKYLSPSALNTYIHCRLRFYFTYIAGLRETDTLSEDIEADTFGNLLHEAMYLNYKDFEGKIIKPSDFDILLQSSRLTETLDKSFRKEYYKSGDENLEVKPEGRNIIVYEVLKRYLTQILEIDKNLAPFEILNLEKEFVRTVNIQSGGETFEVQLGGKIDRVDKSAGITRLIDYKTGKAETGVGSIEKLFTRDVDSRNKAAFQTIMYSWLYSEQNNGNPISPGLYVTRKIFEPDFSPYLSLDKKRLDYHEIENEFHAGLEVLVNEIYNPDVVFDQTSKEDNCTYCPYAGICHRNNSRKF